MHAMVILNVIKEWISEYMQCCHRTCSRYAWDIWDIVWDILGHSVGQSQNTWDIKNVQHWVYGTW